MNEWQLSSGGEKYLNISSSRMKEWKAAYPDVDIELEIQKANAWLRRNKAKMWKTLMGFERWLQRAQDNAPKMAADVKSRGQLSHIDSVQRDYERSIKEAAGIPRPSEEWVEQCLGQLMRSLPAVVREESERVDLLRCDHEFTESYYGGGDWCKKCGMFKKQWFCLRHDRPTECFC